MANRTVTEGSIEGLTEVTDEVLEKDYVSITKATSLLGMAHQQYVRRLVIEGKLQAIKVKLEHYEKWFISRAGINEYMNNVRRTSQLRRYVLRIDQSNEQKVREALQGLNVEFELELNYQGKSEK